MIIKEMKTINGNDFLHTYSDIGKYIERDGVKYVEAIDPLDSDREYVECKEFWNEPADEDYIKAGKILLGVDE